MPDCKSFDGRPLLGFKQLVAPINKNESTKNTLFENSPILGNVHQLLGGSNAPPSVAPPLPDLLRQVLEGKQIQNKTIDDFLMKNKSIKRYSSAFRALWHLLEEGGVSPPQATVDQVADAIVQLFQISATQARNAYSALLLIPGYAGIRFHTLLSLYKRLWNKGTEKYGALWDPMPMLIELATTPLHELKNNLPHLRLQFILCSLILCLYRSSDLANLKRITSIFWGVSFVKVKRKGQKLPKWERMVSIPECPQISPFHLLQAYVEATREMGEPGGGVLLSLNPPTKLFVPTRSVP